MLEDKFLKEIAHARCINNMVEQSGCYAHKMDGDDGIAKYLNFPDGVLSNVDYVCKNDNKVQLIELSDLSKASDESQENLRKLIAEKEAVKGKKLTASEEKKLRRKAWFPITTEIHKKWSGSIAVIERLYRRNNIPLEDPEYHMLIVFKDGTDVIMLDLLKDQLKGMIRNIKVCTTNNVADKLLHITEV